MSNLFFDSSALVKRYLSETGSSWVELLADSTSGHTIIVAEITRVKVAAALASRQRMSGALSLTERDRLFQLLVLHWTTEYRVLPITTVVADRATLLTQTHRLRGYDAVQLAVALDAQATLLAAGLPALTLVSADDDLNAAARAEGLAAENLNAYL